MDTRQGRYIVTLYSKDKATNASDNRVKGKEIEFVVDKTAPSMIVSGIDDNGQYSEETRSVSINVEDNVGLSVVEVYNNDEKIVEFTGEELEETNGNLTVNLGNSNNWQELQVITKDVAGNVTNSDNIKFLLTSNMFVQWYRNPWAVGGTMAVIVIIAGAFVILKRRKKKKMSES